MRAECGKIKKKSTRKVKFLENDKAYFAVFFHQLMSRDIVPAILKISFIYSVGNRSYS